MAMKTYTKNYGTKSTPQTEPIPGSNQIANSAGGFSFELNDWDRLNRFLVLGSEGGSYYASEKQLTLENAKVVERCVKVDGPRTVRTIVSVSHEGRAPKNDPAIFALVICMKLGDAETRDIAQRSFTQVCRTGTHMFQAAEAVKALGGWGRGTKRAFSSWYTSKDAEGLAHQMVKYQNRNGWSHRDILRKLHLDPKSRQVGNLFKWAVGKASLTSKTDIPDVVKAFEAAKIATDVKDIVKLIERYGLPRECVPTQFLNDQKVWEALLTSGKGMPITAMIRNLGKMSDVGLLSGKNDAVRFVTTRLQDEGQLKAARVHPLNILMALRTYASGHGLRGSLSWKVSQSIADALDDAFYRSFKFVEPTGKRHLLALDISGSMHGGMVGGTPLTPAEAAVAMALVTMNVEKDTLLMGFGSPRFEELPISKKDRLDRAVQSIRGMNFGSTDCSLPMKYAQKERSKFDAFFVYTDSETYAGHPHPSQALKQYRSEFSIPAKLVVVGMVANPFTIADPNDPGMLDVAGFDTAAPSVMSDFIRG